MPPGVNDRLLKAKFELKMQEKDLQRQISKKKELEKKEKKALLQVMKSGDQDLIDGQALLVASIQGEIKEMMTTKTNLHIFGGKVEQAATKQRIGMNMLAASRAIGQASKGIKLEQVESVMDDLSQKYQDLDVMTSVMNTATAQATAHQTPQETIDRLKREVADEAGFELSQELNSNNAVKTAPSAAEVTEEAEERLEDTLRALRN